MKTVITWWISIPSKWNAVKFKTNKFQVVLLELQKSRECLARLLDAMLCRICMDRSLDTALFPCGHAVACLDCARRCERCPLCRADIDHCRTIYLPIELTHVEKYNSKIVVDTFSSSKKPSQFINPEPFVAMPHDVSMTSSNIWEEKQRCNSALHKILRLFSCRIETYSESRF